MVPQPRRLERDDPGQSAAELPWWRQLRAWSAELRFEDGPTESILDRGLLPPLPLGVGMYGSAAELCTTSRFAEPEVEGIGG